MATIVQGRVAARISMFENWDEAGAPETRHPGETEPRSPLAPAAAPVKQPLQNALAGPLTATAARVAFQTLDLDITQPEVGRLLDVVRFAHLGIVRCTDGIWMRSSAACTWLENAFRNGRQAEDNSLAPQQWPQAVRDTALALVWCLHEALESTAGGQSWLAGWLGHRTPKALENLGEAASRTGLRLGIHTEPVPLTLQGTRVEIPIEWGLARCPTAPRAPGSPLRYSSDAPTPLAKGALRAIGLVSADVTGLTAPMIEGRWTTDPIWMKGPLK